MARSKFSTGDRVVTSVGSTGKVTAVDPSRGIVAVTATEESLHHRKGEDKVFFENEVKKK